MVTTEIVINSTHSALQFEDHIPSYDSCRSNSTRKKATNCTNLLFIQLYMEEMS